MISKSDIGLHPESCAFTLRLIIVKVSHFIASSLEDEEWEDELDQDDDDWEE